MGHIGLKQSKRINLDFDINKELKNVDYSNKNKQILSSYIESDKYADELDADLFFNVNNTIIAGFDYLYQGRKVPIPEINPVTIYFSNAVMSNYMIETHKKILLEKAAKGVISNHFFGNFFQLAFNCITNLQASLETFLNQILYENNYVFYSKDRKIRKGSIHEKMDMALQEITGKVFKNEYEIQNSYVKNLVSLRNEMVHLKPSDEETNTKYKNTYRKIIDFEFDETIKAVKTFINYYEENLIEECQCGREIYFKIIEGNED